MLVFKYSLIYATKINSQNFQSPLNPNTGAWVLENGFSIETMGGNFICNLNFLY